MPSLVSVVVPVFNGAPFLREAIDSVLAQDYPSLEVLACDDGSSDASGEILRSYGPRLRVVRQRNRGVAAARNRAAALARGSILAFLDQDDVWEPGKLALQVRQFEANPSLGLVYADSLVVDRAGRPRYRRSAKLAYRRGWIFRDLLGGNFIPVETLAMPASVFREVGGFDERLRYLEDFEICLRVANLHPVDFSPEPLARYRVHEGNASHDLEGIVREYAEIFDRLPSALPDLPPEEVARIERSRGPRYGGLAWRALARLDFRAADAWLEKAGRIRPRWLGLKVRAARWVLPRLPAEWAERAAGLMRRPLVFAG